MIIRDPLTILGAFSTVVRAPLNMDGLLRASRSPSDYQGPSFVSVTLNEYQGPLSIGELPLTIRGPPKCRGQFAYQRPLTLRGPLMSRFKQFWMSVKLATATATDSASVTDFVQNGHMGAVWPPD